MDTPNTPTGRRYNLVAFSRAETPPSAKYEANIWSTIVFTCLATIPMSIGHIIIKIFLRYGSFQSILKEYPFIILKKAGNTTKN